jgi:integrase
MRGSIRQRGNTFTAYWSTIDPVTGKRQQHTKGGFRTQGAAQKHLNGVMPLVDQGAGRPDRKMTVEQLLTEWMAAKASEGIRPSTLGMYKNVVDGWLVPHVGGLRLDQLNATRAAQLVETLRSPAGSSLGRGALSPRSIQLAIQCLKASTRWAFETGLVTRDPLAGFKTPKAQTSSAATGAWSADEASAFLASASEDRLRAAWWLLLSRGLRRGEVSGLKWQNVDLGAGTIRVVETRVVVSAKPTASTPKTSAGRRSVPLDDRLVSELKAHWARQARERLAAGEAWEDTDYLFVDEVGHPYRPEMLSRKFTKLSADASLRPIRLHDTRHTAASLMLAAGEAPKVVAELLGHSSPMITMNVYQHLMPGMGEAAGSRLTGLLGGGMPG